MRIKLASLLLSVPFLFADLGWLSTNAAQENDRLERGQNYFGNEKLIDQNGVSHHFFSDLLSQHVVLINVIFTHCQDACPLQTQRLQVVRNDLGKRFGSNIVFLSLTTDPDRDDPGTLKKFAERQQANVLGWHFLTAEKDTMLKILSRFGQWTDDPTNHSTLLIAGNARKGHWIKLRPDSTPERIVADLLRLNEENSIH